MIKVYRFGLLPPVEQADEVARQMRGAHTYRNTLIQIERERRAAHRALLSGETEVARLEAELAAADASVVEAVRALAQAKSAGRTAKVDPEQKAALTARKAVRTSVADALREARRAARGRLREAAAAIDAASVEKGKIARSHRPCAWGTGGIIEAAVEASRKDAAKMPGADHDPRFVGWRGEGAIAVQIQNGRDAEEIEGGICTQLRIDPPTLLRGRPAPRDARTLRIRIGSEADKSPIWAAFPMRMHRPLPPGSRIKAAKITLRLIGPRPEWSVHLTVDMPDAARPEAPGAAVAMDVGWRKIGDGVRVARWVGSDGASGEIRLTNGETLATGLPNLRLPGSIVSGLEKPEGIQQVRDRIFNEARDALTAWLDKVGLPAWSIGQWRSKARLVGLICHWPQGLFFDLDGGAAMWERLHAWRRSDRHLWQYETGQRTGAERARREIYRIVAKELARRYQTLVLEDFDLRQKREPVESETRENETAIGNKRTAALSVFRDALSNAFGARNVTVLDPAYSTKICHACGVVEDFDAAVHLEHTCNACGATWDQDDNAAKNLLAWWLRERSGGGEEPGIARDAGLAPETKPAGETKWAKIKRLRAEKEASRATARNEGVSAAE
jgi:hypothetical protein